VNDMKVCGPGEILQSEFIIPFDLAAQDVATILHCTPEHATDVLKDRVSLTQKEVRWIGKRFGTSAQFWMNLQNNFDAQKALP
jgi:antitoxin HigA-1